MNQVHKEFQAETWSDDDDKHTTLVAFNGNDEMTVMLIGREVYITKAQAMAFFGLVPESKLVAVSAAAVIRDHAQHAQQVQ